LIVSIQDAESTKGTEKEKTGISDSLSSLHNAIWFAGSQVPDTSS
jgi:hypothetical protein